MCPTLPCAGPCVLTQPCSSCKQARHLWQQYAAAAQHTGHGRPVMTPAADVASTQPCRAALHMHRSPSTNSSPGLQRKHQLEELSVSRPGWPLGTVQEDAVHSACRQRGWLSAPCCARQRSPALQGVLNSSAGPATAIWQSAARQARLSKSAPGGSAAGSHGLRCSAAGWQGHAGPAGRAGPVGRD